MPIDPASLTLDQLQTLVTRYQERRLTGLPEYAAYVEAFSARAAVGLKIDVTVATIRRAAAKRVFVSYGDIADANGAVWSKVRRLMPKHLDGVLWNATI